LLLRILSTSESRRDLTAPVSRRSQSRGPYCLTALSIGQAHGLGLLAPVGRVSRLRLPTDAMELTAIAVPVPRRPDVSQRKGGDHGRGAFENARWQ
jgi:hypothetical protein